MRRQQDNLINFRHRYHKTATNGGYGQAFILLGVAERLRPASSVLRTRLVYARPGEEDQRLHVGTKLGRGQSARGESSSATDVAVLDDV